MWLRCEQPSQALGKRFVTTEGKSARAFALSFGRLDRLTKWA